MLARREHSQHEMLQKLKIKGFEAADIQQTLDEFTAKNWQSDQRFAESYIRSRVHKGFGPVKIQYELRERGVHESLDCLTDELPDWAEVIHNLHRKKYGEKAPEDMKEKAKRMRFFQQKGFTHDNISQLFNGLTR